MEERTEYPMLIIGNKREKRDALDEYLRGPHMIDGKEINVSTSQIPIHVDALHGGKIRQLFEGYYSYIVFYVSCQEDIDLVLPMIDTYSAFPVKVIIHEPAVSIPVFSYPKIPRIPKGNIDETMQKFAAEKKKIDEQILAVFKQIDKDNSQKLDANELILAAKELGNDITKEEADNAIDRMDQNGDKLISLQEFTLWWYSGRKLFGRSMKDTMLSSLKGSKSVEEAKAEASTGPGPAPERLTGYTAFNFGNPVGSGSIQAHLQVATTGPEYKAIQTSYFPNYKAGTFNAALLIHCPNAEIAKKDLQGVVDSLIKLIALGLPEGAKIIADLKPEIKVLGPKTIALSSPLTGNTEEERAKMMEIMGLIFPVVKFDQQSITFIAKIATDLEKLATDSRPIFAHILDGVSLELRTVVLKKNIEIIMKLLGSIFRRSEAILKILLNAGLLGETSIKVILPEEVKKDIIKELIANFRGSELPFSDLKTMQKPVIKSVLEELPPVFTDMLNFAKSHVESLEVAAISEGIAGKAFLVLPGLSKLLDLS